MRTHCDAVNIRVVGGRVVLIHGFLCKSEGLTNRDMNDALAAASGSGNDSRGNQIVNLIHRRDDVRNSALAVSREKECSVFEHLQHISDKFRA